MTRASAAKTLARRLWFRRGKVRRAVAGPYRGLKFEISPQVYASRMQIFFRAYEPEVTATLERFLTAPMVVFDIGAHVGIHALYAARLVRNGGRVYAFEPWPENFARLETNIALNSERVAPVEAIGKSVGSHEGPAAMVEGSSDGTHRLAEKTERGYAVAMTTLDAAVGELGVNPDLIIVDVEGGEFDMLAGGASTIERAHPLLIMEHHGSAKRGALSAWLVARGYDVSEISARHILARHHSTLN